MCAMRVCTRTGGGRKRKLVTHSHRALTHFHSHNLSLAAPPRGSVASSRLEQVADAFCLCDGTVCALYIRMYTMTYMHIASHLVQAANASCICDGNARAFRKI